MCIALSCPLFAAWLIPRPASPPPFLGLQGLLEVLFHLRDMPAKFARIYEWIGSPRFPPRSFACQIEIEAVGRKHDIGVHAAQLLKRAARVLDNVWVLIVIGQLVQRH